MPRPDQKTITVKKEVYDQAKQDAKSESVSRYVTDLILKKTKKKEA